MSPLYPLCGYPREEDKYYATHKPKELKFNDVKQTRKVMANK